MGVKNTKGQKQEQRKRGAHGRFVPNEKRAEIPAAVIDREEDNRSASDARLGGDEKDPDKHLPPRARVKKAQLLVLDKMREILTGNCESAKEGNYNAAKFVLDWSGASDIRTPLAKPPQRFSLAQLLRKRAKEAEKEAQETES